MNYPHITKDCKGNIIHRKDEDGGEAWYAYDENGNVTYRKNSDGYVYWQEYNENGNMIHYSNNTGFHSWHEYDDNGHLVSYRDSNNTTCKYHANGMVAYQSDAGGETWYDSYGNSIPCPDLPQEFTLKEIAEKIGVPVGSLRIKD